MDVQQDQLNRSFPITQFHHRRMPLLTMVMKMDPQWVQLFLERWELVLRLNLLQKKGGLQPPMNAPGNRLSGGAIREANDTVPPPPPILKAPPPMDAAQPFQGGVNSNPAENSGIQPQPIHVTVNVQGPPPSDTVAKTGAKKSKKKKDPNASPKKKDPNAPKKKKDPNAPPKKKDPNAPKKKKAGAQGTPPGAAKKANGAKKKKKADLSSQEGTPEVVKKKKKVGTPTSGLKGAAKGAKKKKQNSQHSQLKILQSWRG